MPEENYVIWFTYEVGGRVTVQATSWERAKAKLLETLAETGIETLDTSSEKPDGCEITHREYRTWNE